MNSLSKILTVNILALVAFLPMGLQAQTISVAISVKEPTCFSWTDGSATATPTGGTSPYSYRWSNGQGGGQTVSGIPTGNYSVTVTDAANREAIKSFTVGQPPLLVPAVTAIGNTCDVGTSYTGSASGGVAPYTYAWRNLETNQNVGSTATLTAPTIGSYHLSVTDSRGCQVTKVVNVKPLKVMVIAKPATCGGTCDGSAEAWTDGGTAPYSYRWSTGSTTGIIFPIPGGNYTVTVTDALGCVRVATGTVFEPGILNPGLTVSGQCSGSATATVTPTGGRAPLTVRWSTGATTNTVTNLTQGQYFVTVTDSAGCTKDTFFKVSTGILGLNITKTDASCSGVASGTATVNVTGGAIGAYSYRWSNGATTATISNLNAGTYTVTVTDGAGCSSSQSVNIQSVSSLNLQTAFTNSVCGGSTGTATVTSVVGGTAPYAYRWSNGATTPSVSGLAAGNYTVTVTDASGCSATSGFVIQGQGNLSLTVSSSPSSCGGTTGMATVTSVSGGTAPFTYRWNNGGTTETITNIGAGSYYVTVADAAGCTTSGVVEVQGTNALQINVSTTKADCSAATGTATVNSVTGGIAPYTYLWSTGATTASVSGLPVGTYTLTVTDASGCFKATTIVINANSNLVLTTTTTPSVCGGATGSASVTSVTGGTAPYTYRWHNGGTTATITGLAAGPYFVTVTDATGCTRSSTVDVQATPLFVLIPTATPTTCNGSTGTATIDVTGSTGALIYRWSNGGTTKTISNLAAGTYTVTLTDGSGCSASTSVKVEGTTTSFVINTTSVNSSCSGPTGSATITSVTGGNAPYNYKWSNGETTSSISNLAAATYTVTVTDASGCSQTKNVVVAPVSTIIARLDSTNTACGLTTGIIVVANVTGGTGTYTYLWSNGATSTTLTNLGAGIYTVTITDAAGCKANASTTVRAIGNFDIKTTTTPSACVGATGSATVTGVTGGNAPYTYKWSNGATTNSINNVAAGSYTVTVFDARNCEAVSPSIVVGTNSTIAGAPSVSNATCGKTNGAITLAPTGGTAPYTYTWADQTGTGQPRDRTNLRPGTYAVTINDALGCSAILSNLKIVDTGSIKAQFALQPQGCVSNGDSVIMRLTNNTTAQSASFTSSWLFTGNRTSTVKSPDILYGTTEGEARLIVRSAEGCLDTLLLKFPIDVIKVAITPTPVTTCINTPVTVTATNQNPNFAATFLWDNGATTATRTVTPTAGGITRLILTTKNTYGCTRKDTVNVNAIAPLTPPDLSWKRACEPFKISFFDVNANADQWRWNFGDATNGNGISTLTNPTYTYPNAGNYTVTVSPKTLTCLNTLTLNVTVSDKPAVTVNAGRDTSVCSTDRITLKATGATNFEWSNSPAFTPVLGTGANLLITPSALGSSSYYVRSKDTMGLGCTAIDTIIVDNKAIRIDRTSTIDLCGNADKPITVTNLNAGDRLSVVWTPSNVIVGYTNGDSLRPIVRSNADVTLIGSYKNQFGCTLVDNMNLKAHVFDATAKANITAIYVNDVVTLTATPTGTGYTYAWSPTVNNPTSATTTVSPQTNTTYIVTVTDASGCKDTGQIFLRVMVPQCDEPYIFIPRAFSPNGDGKNDMIYVRGDYLTSVEFVIFNRWGEQVFSTTDKSIGWDGKHRGEPVCPDVYGYYVKGVCQKGEQFFKKGNITVLK
jgi:gliding motility-associated-like protein